MNRRGFLTTCASLLPLPAFVRAASLWLPPERAWIVRPEIILHGTVYLREGEDALMQRIDPRYVHVWLPMKKFSALTGSYLPGATVFVDDERWDSLMEKVE